MFVYCVYSCLLYVPSQYLLQGLTVWLIAANIYRISASPGPHGRGKTQPAPDIRLSSKKHARLRLCPAPTRASGNFVMKTFMSNDNWTCLFIQKNKWTLTIDYRHIKHNWDTHTSYFQVELRHSGNVTAVLERGALLNCRVRGIGNRTVREGRSSDTTCLFHLRFKVLCYRDFM